MKKVILLTLSLMSLSAITLAQNTDLVDQLQTTKVDIDTTTVMSSLNAQRSQYQLKQATSCEQLKSVFIEWSKQYPQYPVVYDSVSSDGLTKELSASPTKSETATARGDTMDMGISTTNTQVLGIDEPDIVKQDERALYFLNNDKQQIEIYAHRGGIGRGVITSTIKLPEMMYGSQLILRKNQLVVVGTYYHSQKTETSVIDNSVVTVVALYDIAGIKDPKLVKYYQTPGYYQDVRLKDNQLTVVSNVSLNLYGLHGLSNTFDAAKMMPRWGYNANPTSIKDDTSLKNIALNCTDVWYPSGTGVTDMSMTSVVSLDLDNQQVVPKATLIAGNTQTMYMSQDRLYLMSNQWLQDTQSACGGSLRCIRNPGTSYTQVISVDPLAITKPIVSRVIGSPLGQYAYHQSSSGLFYLVSQSNRISDNKSVTHVWSLDKNGAIAGALMNIEPGEEFKSSRYIGDKLYLVTFEQIDPLFVIDLSSSNPSVIGELKIPGYSTYLHPYGIVGGKTYLLGLGYDVDNSNGRTVNSGIKLDLYEINYAKAISGNISVKQVQSKRIGGPGTESEALSNPRMFVYDNITKTVYLPLVRMDQQLVKFCPVGITYKPEQCYSSYTNELLFAGYKGITVTPQAITQTKVIDYKQYYQSIAKGKGYGSDAYYINGLNNRVGYVGGKLWFINNWFMRTEIK